MIDWLFHAIIDWIPWWGWVIAVGAIALATMNLWLPIWTVLPRPVKLLLAGIAAIVVAFLTGGSQARKRAAEEQRRKNAEALQRRQDINREVEKMPTEQVDKELKRWQRD